MNQDGDVSSKIFACSGFIGGLELYSVEQLRISETVSRKSSVKNVLLNISKKETPTQAFPGSFEKFLRILFF